VIATQAPPAPSPHNPLVEPRPVDAPPPPAPVDRPSPSVPSADPPRPPAIAVAKLSGGARFGRATRKGRDVIDLHDGELTVDTRRTAPAEIQLGTTAIRVANAKVKVTARTGVLETVAVFAGSVELSSGARSTVVTAGTVWEAPAEPPPDPVASLAAFREGWAALQKNQLAAAIAAFDRATDPIILEDASYWAAVATHRAGDRADARRRFVEFLARFPKSPRAPAARRAVESQPP
jgi:TolA-binding protein